MKEFFKLFETGIKEIYADEKKIVDALPGLIQAASESQLKEALSQHLKETKNQVTRLEEIADELDIDLEVHTPSNIMQALLQKGHQCATSDFPANVKDAAIIAAAQCVEHYEIAVYGTLKAFACLLKLDLAESKLDATLQEESNADKKLSKIAEGTFLSKGVNKKAAGES